MKLYGHLFSSYCQKVLIALYENATPFELCMLAPGHEQNAAEHAALIEPALVSARAYRSRLLARPSFARAVDEARPYRRTFPPGAPDRD